MASGAQRGYAQVSGWVHVQLLYYYVTIFHVVTSLPVVAASLSLGTSNKPIQLNGTVVTPTTAANPTIKPHWGLGNDDRVQFNIVS